MLNKMKATFGAAKEHRGMIGLACGLVGGVAAIGYGYWRVSQDVAFLKEGKLNEYNAMVARLVYAEERCNAIEQRQEFKLRELEEYLEAHLKKMRTDANRRVQEIKAGAEEQSKKMYQDLQRKEMVSQESERKRGGKSVAAPDSTAKKVE
jgi:hypothetical protein